MAELSGPRSTTTVGELPLQSPVVVSEECSLSQAAGIFLRMGVSCVLLRQAPLRVVTERDLMRAWALEIERDEPVASVATEHPFWVPAHASLAEAAAAMVNCDVRHLVVLDAHDRPLGVISMADLFSVLMQSDEPSTMYASFAALLVRAATATSGDR